MPTSELIIIVSLIIFCFSVLLLFLNFKTYLTEETEP